MLTRCVDPMHRPLFPGCLATSDAVLDWTMTENAETHNPQNKPSSNLQDVGDETSPRGGTALKIAVIIGLLLAVTCSHFFTPVHQHKYHLIFDRLGYIPILIAAFWFGLRGGLFASLGIATSHLLHIWLQWGGAFFSENLHQTLEVFMYLAIGVVTGVLSEHLLGVSKRLSVAYRDLRTKTEEVLRAEEQLRRTERIQTLAELSAGIAHEIRTPLASIKGASEILASPSLNDEQREEFTGILTHEVKHLNQVVTEFLDFARPKNKQPAPCDLVQAIDGLLELTFQQCRKRGIHVTKEHESDLPRVLFSPSQLKQVFANLISNAIEAMPEGGALRFACTRDAAGGILCTVEDTGVGIRQDDLPRIFDPFYTTRPTGTGLGLSIVHKILTQHGCTIHADNRDEGGARFVVRFPSPQELPA